MSACLDPPSAPSLPSLPDELSPAHASAAVNLRVPVEAGTSTAGKGLGYHNVEFRRGKIQNLRLDLELVDQYLARHPVRSVSDLSKLRDFEENISHEQPLIADDSVDVIVSNCVLNLVQFEEKPVCACTAMSWIGAT